jgi:hypothetical protein
MFYRGRMGARRPTTCDLVYSDEECRWLKAIDRWKREHDGRTPNCREVLEIARELGYAKTAPARRASPAFDKRVSSAGAPSTE